MNDIVLNKIATIERCLQRIKEEYVGYEEEFTHNYTKQDAVILNLQRACETTIDLASHIVRIKRLGLPQASRDVFVLLDKAGIISSELSIRLQTMVGFRNIAVHDYADLNLNIVKTIIEDRLNDFLAFNKAILEYTQNSWK